MSDDGLAWSSRVFGLPWAGVGSEEEIEIDILSLRRVVACPLVPFPDDLCRALFSTRPVGEGEAK